MNLVFKKSIILAAMTAMLTPQGVFASCSNTSCTTTVHTHIDNTVDSELKTNQIDPMINNLVAKKLKDFLKKTYKAECFVNQIDTINGTITAGALPAPDNIVAAGINEAQEKLASFNLHPITIQLIISSFPHIFLDKFTAATNKLNTVKGDEEKRFVEKIKDQAQRKLIIAVCDNIVKTLGGYFYTKTTGCWGNPTNKKLALQTK